MSGESVIRARGLGKCYHIYARPKDRLKQFLLGRRRTYYREFWANQGIDLDVRRGETLGIVGRNGAGKTTFLQMVAGTLQPTCGSLEVDGRVTALLELGSGFDLSFTGRENVYLSGAVLGVPRRELERRFDDIVAFAEIGEFLDQPVKTYSKGMFVRLAFAVLANLEPDVFVIDEALAVGDAYFRQRCMRRFRELQAGGTTILYVSHDGAGMKSICDRVAWIEGGRLREVGAPDEVVERYLADLFRQDLRPDARATAPAAETPVAAAHDLERALPNVDQRRGDQRLRILGLGLYHADGRPARTVDHGSRLVIRMSVVNEGFDRAVEWIPGYILRGPRGEDLVSSNSLREGVALEPLAPGEPRTVRLELELPLFHRGEYALAPTLSVRDAAGAVEISDQIDAALVFGVEALQPVSTVLTIRTSYELEPRRG
ncbi:MAG: ABC transporter ATP-binding protein [Planctomycetes bacterium]|nr:ABC transporter ATP-binding protein [Planctomycetota bacterium]